MKLNFLTTLLFALLLSDIASASFWQCVAYCGTACGFTNELCMLVSECIFACDQLGDICQGDEYCPTLCTTMDTDDQLDDTKCNLGCDSACGLRTFQGTDDDDECWPSADTYSTKTGRVVSKAGWEATAIHNGHQLDNGSAWGWILFAIVVVGGFIYCGVKKCNSDD